LPQAVTGNLRKLHNEKPHSLYYSPKNIGMIKWWRINMTFSTDVFEQLKGRYLMEYLSTDGSQVLK